MAPTARTAPSTALSPASSVPPGRDQEPSPYWLSRNELSAEFDAFESTIATAACTDMILVGLTRECERSFKL